jgi:uncharacterized protein
MDIAVSGTSGLIGGALAEHLRRSGHVVRALVRPGRPQQPGDVRWDPKSGEVELAALAGIDGVVHVAGAGVGEHRWTASYREEIMRSRVDGTRTIVRAMAALDPRPSVLVSGSAVGWYGDRGDEVLTEASSPGGGFLATVAQAWEQQARQAADHGIRVATSRTGIVLTPRGGALGPLLLFIKAGLSGPLGSGRQWWSWITLEDEVRALAYLLTSQIEGPVNVTSPQPARQAAIVRALARAMHRPSVLPAPSFALRAVLGPMANDLVLASQRALPNVLSESGFRFTHADLDDAARWVAGDR